MNFGLYKQWQRVPGEENWREVEIESIQFVKRVVGVDFDGMAACELESKTEIGWSYDLVVSNFDTQPRTAKLRLDVSRTKHFKPAWKTKTLAPKPRERRIVPVKIAMTKAAAEKLPALYSESLQAFVALAKNGAKQFMPLRAYRPRHLWATLPPKMRDFAAVQKQQKIIAQTEKF